MAENGGDDLPELTPAQVKQFRDAYDVFDKDGDGGITTEELGYVMRALGQNPSDDEVENMFSDVDADGSGEIEFDEFLKIMQRRVVSISSTGNTGENWMEAFKIFDQDGDGFITALELGRVLKNMGEELKDYELDEMIQEADKDGDGRLNYEEFLNIMVVGVKL